MFTYKPSWTLENHIYHPDSWLLTICFCVDSRISERAEIALDFQKDMLTGKDSGWLWRSPLFQPLQLCAQTTNHPSPWLHKAIFELDQNFSEISVRIPFISTLDSIQMSANIRGVSIPWQCQVDGIYNIWEEGYSNLISLRQIPRKVLQWNKASKPGIKPSRCMAFIFHFPQKASSLFPPLPPAPCSLKVWDRKK